MKKFHVPVGLIIVGLAVLGALLHPLALVMSWAPINAHGFVQVLAEVRSAIADLLGWGVLGLLVVMGIRVVHGRFIEPKTEGELFESLESEDSPQTSLHRLPRVVVAITAYNDAEATAQAVRDFKRQEAVVRIIVIDNNSTDQTAELATAAGATVVQEPHQGYGFTCIRGLHEGLRTPEADVIVLTEGDGTFTADDLPKFLTYIDHSDLVVGNRVVKGLVAADSQMDHFFTWGNMAVAMLLRLRFWDGRFLGPAGLTDVGCTYRAIRRDALERILPDLNVGGNHFSPHMLLVAMAHGLSVVEIPIRFRRRIGQSKGASGSFAKGLRVGLTMIWHITTFTPRQTGSKPWVVVERDALIARGQPGNGQLKSSGRSKMEFVAGAAEGLALLSRRGHKIIVISDRSAESITSSGGLTRAIDARISAEVEHRGGRVEAFLHCPHTPGSRCSCRYPTPQLLIRQARRASMDLSHTTVISDRALFAQAVVQAGCSAILVSDHPLGSTNHRHIAEAPGIASALRLVLAEPNGNGNDDSHPVTSIAEDRYPAA